MQAVGSTVSYGKRYTMCALLNISTGATTTNGFKLGDVQGGPPIEPEKQTISNDRLSKAVDQNKIRRILN